jgi:septum formation protein
MLDNLKKYHLILASNSPRRRELLGGLGIEFEVRVMPGIDESYPSMPASDVAGFIAEKKAQAYLPHLRDDELLITADTVVIVDDEILGKPADAADAHRMLRLLSGRTHQVITGVCIATNGDARYSRDARESGDSKVSFSVSTDVTFKPLSEEEIDYYVTHYRPFDKAGAYGIQEWIGYIGVTGLRGSYFNVMGLPVQRIYQELTKF